MGRKILKNKPLVEAIFELRWELQETSPEIEIDPHYKVLIGRMYDRVSNEYSFHQQLPTAAMPDEIAGYVVQHRFRKGKDEWPLIQLGPGIMTLNDTEGYAWEDFEERITKALDILFESYPQAENNLKIKSLLLRYIDAVDFNYDSEHIFDFIENKMKTNIKIYDKLFVNTEVEKLPRSFDLRFSFNSFKPKGTASLRFARGKKKENDALIWETIVQSRDKEAPKNKNEIYEWLRSAHDLTDDWFFKIIEGDLEGRFQ